MNHHHRLSAFSLVEIAVVVSVIGLILGGVIAGQHVMTAAELNKIMQQAEFYNSAQINFQNKYRAWPGDMYNATDFFGLDPNMDDDGMNEAWCENGHNGSVIDGFSGTCNGDGNGFPGRGDSTLKNALEILSWPQHLSGAGLIQGTYVGSAKAWAGADGELYIQSPRDGTHWHVTSLDVDNRLHFGFLNQKVGMVGVVINGDGFKALTPEEAWSIDRKMDDGNPTSGLVGPSSGKTTGAQGAVYCTLTDATPSATTGTISSNTEAVYNINHPERACDLKFYYSSH